MKSTKKYFNSDNKFNKIVEARLGRRKAQNGGPTDLSVVNPEYLKNLLKNSGINTDFLLKSLGEMPYQNDGADYGYLYGTTGALANIGVDNVPASEAELMGRYAQLAAYHPDKDYSPDGIGAMLGIQAFSNDPNLRKKMAESYDSRYDWDEGGPPFAAAQNPTATVPTAVSIPDESPTITPTNYMDLYLQRMQEIQNSLSPTQKAVAAPAAAASNPVVSTTNPAAATPAAPAVPVTSDAAVPAPLEATANPAADMTTTGGAGEKSAGAVAGLGAAASLANSAGGKSGTDVGTILGGAASGASIGSLAGPIGTGVGAVVGAGIAGYGMIVDKRKAEAAENQAKTAEKIAGQYDSQVYDQTSSVTAPFTGQTYGVTTGTKTRYLYEKGGVKDGAKDVSNLGKMPKGTTVKLPGGKAVSMGGNKVEYIGNSHEKGGILTGGKEETFEVENGELEVEAETAEGDKMRYILSDYPKFAVNGETPADMVRNGKPIQDAVKINEFMASRIPTEYGGPADPSRSPNKFAQAGTWKTEDDKFQFPATRPGYLDMGGNINASSWRNIQNTDWGQYYGVTDKTTQEELQQIYNNQYMADVNRFYSQENKDQAIETLRLFAEDETPAGDNFRRAFRGLDFDNPQHHQRILTTAKRKSTDGKIGAFHFIPVRNAAENEGAKVAGTAAATTNAAASEAAVADTTADVANTTLGVTEEEKKKIPGLGYKGENAVPGLAFLGMGAGLLPAFAPKVPPAELIKGTPGIRAPRLPRENLKGQEAAVASDFAAIIESLERAGNSSSGIYNNFLLKKLSADSQTAAQELSANKQLAGQEAGLGLRASEANMSADIARQARNADAINRREEFKQEQVRADLDNISKNLQQGVSDVVAYKTEKQLADAIDVYDTRGYNRTLKMYQKERDKANRRNDTGSPFYNKTDDELRQHAQAEIQSRTGFDPEDKTMPLEQVMKMLELMTKTDQGDPKPKRAGGKKYFSKINKIRR